MNLSEQIEALQAKWRSLPSNCPETIAEVVAAEVVKVCAGECAADLAPLLVAAKEQEEELATLKEPKCPICGKKLLSGISWCFSHASPHAVPSVECECGYCNAAICADDKNSADLREVAEMAIARCSERCKEKAKECPQPQAANTGSCHMGDAFACLSIMPDDVLREFREKKAKVNHD